MRFFNQKKFLVPPAKYPSAPPPVKTYNPNPQNQHQNYQQPNYPPPNYPQQNVYDGKFAPQYPSSYGDFISKFF